jgi:6-phospho-3-hexuloisomerase
LAAKGFANRLMHLGFQAYVIGEISTPHTKAGDLLIITSGSGETDALVSIAKKAKESGLYLGLVTMNPQSTLGKMADGMIILSGDSKGNNEEKHSIQPMGSQFEQMSFLIFDAIVLKLMENWNQTSEQMFMRHADLE